ncbi:MAG: hypothetical protein QW400_03035 [Candidatus Diapherotrites archaeon]
MPVKRSQLRAVRPIKGSKVSVTARRICGVTITNIREKSSAGKGILRHLEVRRGSKRISYTVVGKSGNLSGDNKTVRRIRSH